MNDKPLEPCPIPPEKLAKNQPDYGRTYSFGENIEGCEANEIYSLDNYVEMVFRQQTVFDMRPANLAIPIFTWENPGHGDRTFTICSRRAMCNLIRRSNQRFYYWQITQHDPCNYYLDFDMSYADMRPDCRGTRSVNGAIREVLACIDLAIAHEKQETENPSFANVTSYTVSRLDANKVGKESTHLNIHFEGLHMFQDFVHAQYFCALMMKISNLRHPDKATNPLYYWDIKIDGYKPILDYGCFMGINRNWRCIGCFKNKVDPTKITGPIYPPCGTDNLICDSLDCPYHIGRMFSDAEFCENDPTFIPRADNGYPCDIRILTMTPHEMPDLKRNTRTGAPRRLADSGTSSNLTMPDSPSRGGGGDGNLHAERRAIMDCVIEMLTKMKGQRMTMGRFIHDEFARIGAPETWRCIYRYKLLHKMCRRTEIPLEDTIPNLLIKHNSNNVQYLVRINLPAPFVYVHCTALPCQEFIAELKHKDAQIRYDYEVQMVDVNIPANADLMAKYTRLVIAYMLKCTFPDELLTSSGRINGHFF